MHLQHKVKETCRVTYITIGLYFVYSLHIHTSVKADYIGVIVSCVHISV